MRISERVPGEPELQGPTRREAAPAHAPRSDELCTGPLHTQPVAVNYDVIPSPVGPLFLATSSQGLCRVSFDPKPGRELERLATRYGASPARSPAALAAPRRELDAYFAGALTRFTLSIDIRGLPDFETRALEALSQVEFGHTTTYGELAARIHEPGGARAVGRALNRNPVAIVLPCHRVLGSRGALVGFGGGLDRKHALLALEGVML